MDISYDDFWAYENVRRSGVTNMYDLGIVKMFSGLTKAEIMYIIKNYTELEAKFVDKETGMGIKPEE